MSIETPARRVPLSLPIEFRKNYSRKVDLGDLKNISLSGAFLEHNLSEIILNEKLNISFQVSGRKRVLNASVVWNNADGSGIQFHPTNNRDIQIVDDLIYFVNGRRSSNRGILDNIINEISRPEDEES